MCDYWLQGMDNRMALEGEVLEVYRFQNGSKGLTSPDYLNATEPSNECAVCVPDGAELAMTGISPAFQFTNGVSPTEVVIFHRVSDVVEKRDSENIGADRETVEFRNGIFVALQDLDVGQRIGILALSAAESIIRREMLNSYIVE